MQGSLPFLFFGLLIELDKRPVFPFDANQALGGLLDSVVGDGIFEQFDAFSVHDGRSRFERLTQSVSGYICKRVRSDAQHDVSGGVAVSGKTFGDFERTVQNVLNSANSNPL